MGAQTNTMALCLADTAAQPIRPQTLPRETCEAFVISTANTANKGARIPLEPADDFDHALQIGERHTAHKGYFMIRRTNMLTGAVMLSFYVVKKKSRPEYRYRDYQTRAVHDTYAEHLFDLAGEA